MSRRATALCRRPWPWPPRRARPRTDGRTDGGGDCDTAATFARACRAGRWQIEFQCLEMLLMIMSLSRGGTPPAIRDNFSSHPRNLTAPVSFLPSFLPSRRAPCCSNGFVNGGRRATTLRRASERARGPPADGLPPRTERATGERPTRWYRYAPGVVVPVVCLRSIALFPPLSSYLSVVCQVVREWTVEAGSQGILSRATCYTTKTFPLFSGFKTQ